LSEACEITLEANPTSVELEKFRGFRAAGVNRVSIGVQSLRPRDLDFLGRKHDAAQARRAIEAASQIFDRYSFDLIYARPEQTLEDWEDELSEALPLARDHLSLYQLTIEKGTPFYMQHARGDFKIPDEELSGAFYERTQTMLEAAGLPAYEVSNHARAGAGSEHNLTYWRYADYVGIGPGAHGRLTLGADEKKATRGHRAPELWLEKAQGAGSGAHEFETLSRRDRLIECLMMGLRLNEGVPVSRLEREGGEAFDRLISLQKIESLRSEGLITYDGVTLRATKDGMQRLNGVLGYLL
jgi:oxygen-independent coproporphyrinogen-3 oxidase